ncbi:hypothetical protein Tco_0528285 [Tanacetum coccineum]
MVHFTKIYNNKYIALIRPAVGCGEIPAAQTGLESETTDYGSPFVRYIAVTEIVEGHMYTAIALSHVTRSLWRKGKVGLKLTEGGLRIPQMSHAKHSQPRGIQPRPRAKITCSGVEDHAMRLSPEEKTHPVSDVDRRVADNCPVSI